MGIDVSGIYSETPLPDDALELALFWAARGFPVLPSHPETKAPWIGAEWQRKASTDPDEIRGWGQWKRGAKVGFKTGLSCGDLACGCLDGPDVLDFDVWDKGVVGRREPGPKPGLEQRAKLVQADILDVSQALVVRSKSPRPTDGARGEHWYFAGSQHRNKQNDDSIPGVDLRAHHGFIVAPGNPGYEVVSLYPVDLGPLAWDRVLRLLVPPARPVVSPAPSRPAAAPAPAPAPPAAPVASPVVKTRRDGGRLSAPVDFGVEFVDSTSPLDWYVQNTDFLQALVDDGWTVGNVDPEGRQQLTRPGKELRDGISGNLQVQPDGRTTLWVFSSSTEFPQNRSLSAAQWYAYRFHGGSMADAARAIRRERMPRPAGQTAAPAGPPAARDASTPPTPPPGLPALAGERPTSVISFWQRRPELAEVWFKATIGETSPWAVLGYIIANIAVRVGPHVVLPPPGGVGKPGSLNMLIAVTGDSGDGKGLSAGVAMEFIGPPIVPPRKPGTGQGIAAMFTEQTKAGPVQVNDTVLLDVKEITNLGAHASMQGSNLVPTLLEVAMAEALGEHYADKEKRRPVHDGAYRLALVAGVQPTNAGIILDHAGSGLPQRFLWLPAFWADAVLPENSRLVPPAPGPELPRWRAQEWMLPGSLDETLTVDDWQPTDAARPQSGKEKETEADAVPIKDPIKVTYGPTADLDVRLDRRRRMNAKKRRVVAGEATAGDADAHLLLTKIKVATMLAIWLDKATHISDEIWDLAGIVIWISNETRINALKAIQKAKSGEAVERARARADSRQIEAEETERKTDDRTRALIARVSKGIHNRLSADWVPEGAVNRGISSEDKRKLREAGLSYQDLLSDLERVGMAEQREPEGKEQGTRWRRKAG